ncbi:MAG: hypothetical protein LBR23_02185 [Spirochaetaceae bacterium]|jgi:TolB-like protein|nr:hypothetical protein [Spirochaetaceae bacterium]
MRNHAKLFAPLWALILALAVPQALHAQTVTLDEGIANAAQNITDKLEGASVAVFNIQSDYDSLSDYIFDELTIALSHAGADVLDRKNMDIVNLEITEFGRSGAQDMNTVQDFGNEIGAKAVIIGSFAKAGAHYRFRIQVIETETKRVLPASQTLTVREDEALLTQMGITLQRRTQFTAQQKTQAGLKNLLAGWGSYSMGDPLDGTLVLVAEVGGYVLAIVGAGMALDAATAADNAGKAAGDRASANVSYAEWAADSKAREKAYQNAYDDAYWETYNKKWESATPLLVSGGIMLAGGIIWGFVAPYVYDRPQTVKTTARASGPVPRIGLTAAPSGALAGAVSWRLAL